MNVKKFVAIVLIVAVVASIGAPAYAKKRTYAVCLVAVEDALWVYDTYKVSAENFEKHHVGSMNPGKKFKVYETKNGMGRIKYKGKRAWVSTKNLEVVKKGYVKVEGKWKKVKPGFSFWLYIKFGESGY